MEWFVACFIFGSECRQQRCRPDGGAASEHRSGAGVEAREQAEEGRRWTEGNAVADRREEASEGSSREEDG